jgi:hypothetical protein
MANVFKNAFAANVNNVAYVDLYTAPAGTTTVILGLSICNKTAGSVYITVQIQDTSASGADFQILDTVSVPLEVLAGQKYILESTDVLRVKSGASNSIDVSLGLMEIA